MSSGTTTLVAADTDDGASTVQTLPFDFFIMGQRFNQFSATSNGLLGLGSSAVSGSLYTGFSGTLSSPVLSPFGGDLRTGIGGQVRSKVTGTAPNRVLTVEFNNMSLLYVATPGSNDGTYQVRLYETTGQIDYVYGPMTRNSGTSALNGQQVGIGWSTANSANNMISITSTTNLASTAVPFGQALYATGAIANLNSPVEGARRTYSMLPPVPTAPTNLTFTGVTQFGMTLNWTDSPNEVGYGIYRSTDNINYTYISAVASDATSYTASGLTPNTLYYWKVYALSEGAVSTALAGSQASGPIGNIFSTPAGGNWSAPGTWVGGVVPTSGDNVTIVDGSTVTIDAAATANANNLTVGQGTSGVLIFNSITARTLTLVQSLTVAAGVIFQSGAAGTVTTHLVSVGQDVTNNGTIDFSTSGNAAGAVFSFTGSNNATFTNNGVLDLRAISGLQVNKGTGAATVFEFIQNSATNVTTQGAIAAGFLALTNGTFKLSGTTAFSNPVFNTTSYTIASGTAFWLNNANATVLGQAGSPTNAGLLRITAGTFNIGNASGNAMGASTGAVFTIEGGTMNVAGRLQSANAITYNQSGGVVNVNTIGNGSSSTASLGFTSTSSVMNMSGSTINLVQASTAGTPLDYNVAGVLNYTAGTLNIGTAATTTNFIFRIQGSMPSVVVDNTTSNKIASLTGTANVLGSLTLNAGTTLNMTAGGANVFGTLTINTGATLNLNPGTAQTLLMLGTTLTNNGAIIVNTTNTGTVNFAASLGAGGAQTYQGTGTFGSATLMIATLSLQNGPGLTLAPGVSPLNVLRVNLFYGQITNSNLIALGNGGATVAVVQRGVTGNILNAGSFDTTPTYNVSGAGLSIVYGYSITPTSTGPEISATRSILNMTITDLNGVMLTGGPLTITGTLTLTAGTLTTTATNLPTLTNTAVGAISLTAGASYVNGPLERTLPASLVTGSTYTFPVGKSAYKLLELVNPTTNAGGTVVVHAEVFDADSGGTPCTGLQSINHNRYWQATFTSRAANFTNTTMRLTDSLSAGNAIGQSATQAAITL